jgi:hypothetical protein
MRAMLAAAALATAACSGGTAERGARETLPADVDGALAAARSSLEQCARASGDRGLAHFAGRVTPDGALHVTRVDGPFGRPARDCLADAVERAAVRPFQGADRPLDARFDLSAAPRTLDRTGAE